MVPRWCIFTTLRILWKWLDCHEIWYSHSLYQHIDFYQIWLCSDFSSPVAGIKCWQLMILQTTDSITFVRVTPTYPADISCSHYRSITWFSYQEVEGMMVKLEARSTPCCFNIGCVKLVDIFKRDTNNGYFFEQISGQLPAVWKFEVFKCQQIWGLQKRTCQTFILANVFMKHHHLIMAD